MAEPVRQSSLSSPRLVLYAGYNIAASLLGWGIIQLYPVFNLALGLSPALVGLAQSLPRFIDLVTDPLAGYLSDSMRARFSRTYFMRFGTLVGAAGFTLLWLFPAHASPAVYFIWIFGCTAVALAGWSFLAVPGQALCFELSSDPAERTKLMATVTFMGNLAFLGSNWAYPMAQLKWFRSSVQGVHFVGVGMAVMIAIFGLVGAAACRGVVATPSGNSLAPRSPGLKDFGTASLRLLRNRPFMLLLCGIFFIVLGSNPATLGLYIFVYYIRGGSQTLGIALWAFANTAYIVGSLVATGPVLWLSRRYSRKATLMGFLVVAFIGNVAKWWLYDPAHVWLAIIPLGTLGLSMTALWVLSVSMIADISDIDHAETGAQDSGLFSAFFNWITKAGGSMTASVCGLLVVWSGFNVANGGRQGPAVLLRLRWFDFGLSACSIGLALVLIGYFPVTEAVGAAARLRLQKRQGQLTASLAPAVSK